MKEVKVHLLSSPMVNILTWNIRGFNNSFKQKEVNKLISTLKVDIFCLLETRVSIVNYHSIIQTTFPNWKFENNYSVSNLGKIWIFWNNSVDIYVLAINQQAIQCQIISFDKSFLCNASFVYGSYKDHIRE